MKTRRWRESDEVTEHYQVPYRCLVPQSSVNLLVAGRCLDADPGAFGAVRVMVNCNQMGEAAGTACSIALQGGGSVASIPVSDLQESLRKGGALI